jgi:alpha-tubulin suppressor-like RCC1 family protein
LVFARAAQNHWAALPFVRGHRQRMNTHRLGMLSILVTCACGARSELLVDRGSSGADAGQHGDTGQDGDVVPQTARLAAGASHTCAVDRLGSMMCWGYNIDGELGRMSHLDSALPSTVLASPPPVGQPIQGVTAAAAGARHSCAIANGSFNCWGMELHGELGNGTANDDELVASPGIAPMARVTAGATHSCGIDPDANLLCWGANDSGQLGDGTHIERDTPTVVLAGVSDVSASLGAHTCAIAAGQVECWGANDRGQLGDGTTSSRSLPHPVDVGVATSVSAGFLHTCAALTNGDVMCWGSNGSGELGDGTTDSLVPVAAGVHDAVAVSAGQLHTCSLSRRGAVTCWGSNAHGQLGVPNAVGSATPIASGAVAVASGALHACALMSDDAVWCWGLNLTLQLGVAKIDESHTPVKAK